jgi:hypothetical protein
MRVSAWPIALSVVVGAGTALVELQVGIGVVAGLVVAAIGMQIQLAIEIRNADVEAQVRLRELSPITAVKELDGRSADFLNQLATAQIEYLSSGTDRPTVFDLELDHRRTMLLEQYQECARGTMRLNLRPVSILRETDGVTTVSEELKATSVVPAERYWNAPSGLSYLDQQEDMLGRGVRIQRVFIQPETTLEELVPVISRHLAWRDEYGAERLDVRVALMETLSDDLISDYAIVDLSSVIRLEIQHGLDQPTAVTWHTSPNAVDAAIRLYQRLWVSGRDPAELAIFGQ